ncbi:MAG: DUF3108 domain-containing protein [Deltaproteobacteria bacterium]|nr:DUF3108 domain-containing protein [Deltaproteobacteria bacterium]
MLSFCAAGHTSEEVKQVSHYQPRFFPFDGGEKAEYRVSWNMIPVASADVQTNSLWEQGEKYYRVNMRAKTWKVLHWIWRMRDSVEAVFEANTFSPRKFNFSQSENRERKHTSIHYEPDDQKWVVHRKNGDKEEGFEFVSGNTYDPVSASYRLRSLDFKVGDRIGFNLYGGHNHYQLTLDVIGREPIKVKAGRFHAFKIRSQMVKIPPSEDDGYVYRATGWISADDKRILVKAKSKAWIGSVNLELIRAELPPSQSNSSKAP